jgi:CheY-like chemotaxis protein
MRRLWRERLSRLLSTKGIGKGTGLGLSMAHGLAAQLGGAMTIQSRIGVGTNVELWLPVSAAALTELDARESPIEAEGDRGFALLVDDEDLVRASTADMLISLGYRVGEAASGGAALMMLHAGAKPDVLITDHLMPGMTGVELVRKVREKHPDLPALIVSGYTEAEEIAPDLPRLIKPFRRGELAEKLGGLKIGCCEHVRARASRRYRALAAALATKSAGSQHPASLRPAMPRSGAPAQAGQASAICIGRRRIVAPTEPKPRISSAHVPGSGTAGALMAPLTKFRVMREG